MNQTRRDKIRTIVCKGCQQVVTGKMPARQEYCSKTCFTNSLNTRVKKTCQMCGDGFEVKKYKEDTARFCGRRCASKWDLTYNRKMAGPSLIGNTLRKGLRPTNAFTSEQVKGSNNPKWVDPLKFTCKTCGKEFERKPWQARQRNNNPQFCSVECWTSSNDFIRGDNHPHYVGGPKTYRGRSWLKARLVAVERDNGTCQKCGKHIGKSIPVHHIKPFREFEIEAEANQADNLICLCQSCHMKNEPH